ncbi:porin [Comamonas sp. NLF-1-9]|uniref:porin n=1 Tax=Comamonas sp. NLF-1-9 TaxID=2853163 RepID=UPI001C46B897|nr:porin [Comamonas sp. NLF-1-9]QXL83438.1 porin [Comamonas sp. NLF-1-9]
MKKSLIALAVLGASGFAMAQSSVTLYGVADAGIGRSHNYATGVNTTGMKANDTVNNGNSRLGVRGVEDLGGGLKAGFNFEAGLNLKTGANDAAFWQRNANMYLAGSWGQFLMGRTLDPSFFGAATWELTGMANYSVVANTFGFGGDGTPRNNSQFTYTSPNFGGFSGSLGYIFKDDNGGNAKWDLNLKYANGPLGVALTANKTQTMKTGWSLGGQYKFGTFVVAASYNDLQTVRRGFSIGGTANFGPGSVTLDLTRDTKNPVKKYTNALIEGKYSLSKRTFVYADYLRLDGENNYGIGVRHNF